MKKNWNISLVVTFRNAKVRLEEWVNDVLAQSRRPNEIVVCDGGSTDGTWEEIQRLSALYPELNLVAICRPDTNIAAGRNAAIGIAKGPIIAVTDAGCRLDKYWLEKITHPIQANLDTPQFVAGSFRYASETVFQKTAAIYLGPVWKTPNFRPSSRSVAFTLSAWKAVGGYPEWMTLAAEDTLFNCAIYAHPDIIRVQAPEAIVTWDIRPSLSSLMKMIRRNAFGDAEAGLGRTAFLKTFSRILTAFFVLLIAGMEVFFVPPFLIFGVILPLILSMAILMGFVCTRRLPCDASRIQFLLMKLLGGPSYVFGYLKGLAFGRKPPRHS